MVHSNRRRNEFGLADRRSFRGVDLQRPAKAIRWPSFFTLRGEQLKLRKVSKMGKLLVMPAQQQTLETNTQPEAVNQTEKAIDFNVWKSAPRERTPQYFPVYRNVSRAMQGAMRRWTREWFHAHP